jgi:chromate reductase, NAD(P)H dehydrogenase (quinone)
MMTTVTEQSDNAPVQAVSAALRILCISGSLRRDSYNRMLLTAAEELAPPDAALELWDGLKAVPPFDEDDESDPGAAVMALREAISAADGVLIATPQYNASFPGQLKNALDWASRPYEANVLRGKPVAVIGASPSRSGAARAQAEARTVLNAIGAEALDAELALPRASEQFDPHGQLATETTRLRLRHVIERLAARARGGDRLALIE